MKKRIAYIGWSEPGSASGATLALQRHLFAQDEWDVLVATDKPYKDLGERDRWVQLQRSPLYERAARTRLRRIMAQYEMLVEPFRFAVAIEERVRDFAPDVILTIPDNTISWTARLLSRRLGIPLVCNFQDWWPRGQFYAPHEAPFPPVRIWLERRFREMYRASRVAFCTSEGFKRYLGPHDHAPVLYPCPADRPETRPPVRSRRPEDPVKITYGGTLVGHYGRMLLGLAREISQADGVQLELYGGTPDWPAADLEWARQAGIYRGMLPQAEFRKVLELGDVFLTVMTHSQDLRIMMETSFTTKFLEYCQFGRPVIVWGPDYCEPVRTARASGAGIVVSSESPAAVICAARTLTDPGAYAEAATAAWQAALSIFDPAEIHQVFRDGIAAALVNDLEPKTNQPS